VFSSARFVSSRSRAGSGTVVPSAYIVRSAPRLPAIYAESPKTDTCVCWCVPISRGSGSAVGSLEYSV